MSKLSKSQYSEHREEATEDARINLDLPPNTYEATPTRYVVSQNKSNRVQLYNRAIFSTRIESRLARGSEGDPGANGPGEGKTVFFQMVVLIEWLLVSRSDLNQCSTASNSNSVQFRNPESRKYSTAFDV